MSVKTTNWYSVLFCLHQSIVANESEKSIYLKNKVIAEIHQMVIIRVRELRGCSFVLLCFPNLWG